MEHCYKLNLPSLEEVLLDFEKEIISLNQRINPIYFTKDSDKMFKSNWLTFNDISWCTAMVFYKPHGFIGRTHTDKIDGSLAWGINWISGGSGTIEFWDRTKISLPTIVTDSVGYKIEDYDNCVKDVIAHKTYIQDPGVYLINGTSPHRATGFDNRVCVSLRSFNNYYISWEQIVEKFKNYYE